MRSTVKSMLKAGANAALDSRFHWVERREAHSVLSAIEKDRGKTDPKLLRLSKEYAKDVFGWVGYAPWLYVYSAVAGEFREGWIPKNYYIKTVLPTMKGLYGRTSLLKSLSTFIFDDDAFPDIAKLVNGSFYTADGTFIDPADTCDILFENREDVVFKTDKSYQGMGVFFFDRSTFDTQKVRQLGNGVFQSRIEQHGFFDQFSRYSVGTLRITTVVDARNRFSVRSCYLRLGQGDDTHVASRSHIRIPVDVTGGILEATGYLPNWRTIDRHPDSQALFGAQQIPGFADCLATVERLHRKFPYLGCIGWDVTVDGKGAVQVMEWNGNNNDIKFSEATQGPCFADMGWETLWR